MRTIYTDARIFRGGRFETGEIAVEQGRIVPVGERRADDRIVRLGGRWLVPGLVDVHAFVASAAANGIQKPSRAPTRAWVATGQRKSGGSP